MPWQTGLSKLGGANLLKCFDALMSELHVEAHNTRRRRLFEEKRFIGVQVARDAGCDGGKNLLKIVVNALRVIDQQDASIRERIHSGALV
jgi:hypothetical protein